MTTDKVKRLVCLCIERLVQRLTDIKWILLPLELVEQVVGYLVAHDLYTPITILTLLRAGAFGQKIICSKSIIHSTEMTPIVFDLH